MPFRPQWFTLLAWVVLGRRTLFDCLVHYNDPSIRVAFGIEHALLAQQRSGKVIFMPSREHNQLLRIVVQTCFGNCIVPIGNAFTHDGRPCRFRILVNIIHDKDVHGFTRQCTAHTNGLESAAMPNDFAFIGIAQP